MLGDILKNIRPKPYYDLRIDYGPHQLSTNYSRHYTTAPNFRFNTTPEDRSIGEHKLLLCALVRKKMDRFEVAKALRSDVIVKTTL